MSLWCLKCELFSASNVGVPSSVAVSYLSFVDLFCLSIYFAQVSKVWYLANGVVKSSWKVCSVLLWSPSVFWFFMRRR